MRRLANWTLAALVCVVVYLIGEGVLAINHWERSHRSLAYHAVQMAHRMSEPAKPRFFRPVLSDTSEIEPFLDDMHAAGVGLGNSPYEQLRTAEASITETLENGCIRNRPDVRKIATYLRTPLFERFNPIAIFFDADRPLPDRLQRFVDLYGVRPTLHSTDQWGQRRTLPEIDHLDKVLIAGDSVANGAMLDDRETLSSMLQQRDPHRRYVNLGIGGAEAAEIRCALEQAAARYPNQARELIYVYCENDFDEDERMGTPEAVMSWLPRFVREQAIDRVTIVYAPYIFNVVPELTRVPGERGEHFDDHADEKARLLALVRDAGFAWVDFGELALAEADARRSPFGALALYLDVVHHSPLGVARLADALHAEPKGVALHRP